MSQFATVSRERHAQSRWRRYRNYAFAAHDTVVALAAAELPRAMLSLPLAFVRQKESFVPVAVLGLRSGENLLVAPDGRWLAGYVPAALRCYPFALTRAADGQQLLAIDEASGLLSVGSEGEAFFDGAGNPSPAVAELLEFLRQTDASRGIAEKACAAMHAAGLIQPWNITFRSAQGEQNIQGLFQVDEAALNALPDEAFLQLRRSGALAMAYCQLLSMQNLQALGRLAESRAAVAALPAELDLEFLKQGDTLSFGSLR